MNALHVEPHSPLVRAGEERNRPEELERMFLAPGARLVTVDHLGRHQVLPTGESWDPAVHFYLGHSAAEVAEEDDPGEHHWFARRGTAEGLGLRESSLSPLIHDVVTAATAILAWHDRAPNCEACGAHTTPLAGGFVRGCQSCGSLLFPRQDPAVIVAVVDPQDRLLLAHQVSWPQGRVSVLAGFVEAGESLEQTCGRELLEEVGIRVEAVRYVASQPWPFPRSLMLGFSATASGEPEPDGVEIQWAKWYTREEFDRQLAAGEISIPGRASLGRALIEAWHAGTLEMP